MSSVTVKTMPPHQLLVEKPKSVSAHILRKRQVEILANENTSFEYSSNDRMVFNISSNTEFLDALNSYLRFDLTCVLTDAGGDIATKALPEGGVMGLFRTVELRTQSGVLIERWDRANVCYAMLSNATHGREFVDGVLSKHLDSTANTGSRNLIAKGLTGAPVECTMAVPLGFLNMDKSIPLMYIKQGLQLIFELERPEFALESGGAIGTAIALKSATISSPRYVAMMVTPDESIMGQYEKMYSGEGLHYGFTSFKHRRQTIQGTNSGKSVLNHHMGVRSARAAFTVIQSSLISDTAGDIASRSDSISTFVSMGCKQYQYRVGSEEYPYFPVDVNQVGTSYTTNVASNSEALAELMIATAQYNSKHHNVRFNPVQFRNDNEVFYNSGSLKVDNETTKLILSAELGRDPSPWAGVDLSINDLQVELDFEASATVGNTYTNLGNRVVHTFVVHDVLCSISKASGIVIRK
jgi:hypothetical protein